jgi:hypothetical protein
MKQFVRTPNVTSAGSNIDLTASKIWCERFTVNVFDWSDPWSFAWDIRYTDWISKRFQLLNTTSDQYKASTKW